MDNNINTNNTVDNREMDEGKGTAAFAIRKADIKPAEITPKKINSKKIIIIIAVALIIAAVIISVIVFGKEKNTPDNTDVNVVVTEIGTTEVIKDNGEVEQIPVTSLIYTTEDDKRNHTDSADSNNQTKPDSAASANGNGGNADSPNANSNQNTPHANQNQGGKDNGKKPVQTTAAPVKVKTQAEALDYFINSINRGNYSMTGKMSNGSDSITIGLTYGENGSRISSVFEGIEIEIAVVDKKIYMINTEKKTYMTLTESLVKQLDLDLSELDDSELKWEIAPASTARKSKAEINGKNLDCYELQINGADGKIYFDGNDVKRLEIFKPNGAPDTVYELTSFKGDITKEDLLPGSDYKSQNALSFVMNLMGEIE